MSSKNTISEYFIGYADLSGRGEVMVEHYSAESPYDCIKQCLNSHDIFVHSDVDTVEGLFSLARHRNKIISFPRKVKITII